MVQLVTPADLGVYLNDDEINPVRAAFLIQQAQTLCESIVSPLPDAASVVVTRVAGRAYVTVTSSRQMQLEAAGSPYGGTAGGMGGVWLSRSDKSDLRSLGGSSGGAFEIDMLPAGYAPSLLPWDVQGDVQADIVDEPLA